MLPTGQAQAGSGGPDPFGYVWRDINDPAGCPIQPDVFVLANSGNFNTDFALGPFDLGFSFPFYDRLVTQVWFHQAGLVAFQAPPNSSLFINQDIPRVDGIAGFIAPYWSFLTHATPSVYWESFAAQGYFKASFQYTRAENGTQPLQFEVYLYQSGDIRIEYLRPSDSPLVTIGMEGFTETAAQALKMRYNATQLGGMTYGTPTPFAICIERPSSLNCSSALPLACGAITAGTSPAAVAVNTTAYGCGMGSWLGNERVYEITVTNLSDLTVALSGTGARLMAAFLLRNCDEYECIAGGSGNFQALTVPPGTYYVVVDAATAADNGAFTILVTCTAVSEPIACGETLADTTVGQANRLNGYPCLPGDFSGAEQFYTVNFTPPGNLNVSLTSGTGQAVFILDGSQPFSPAACLVAGVGGAILYGPPAGSYVIVVDGPAAGNGAYTLALNCNPAISCTAAPDMGCQQRVTGSTVGLSPRADFYRCAATLYDGPEAVYRFTNLATSTVSFVLDDSANPDLDLILLGSCNESDCVEIGDNIISSELGPGTYYIVVDGRNGAAANYELTIICGFGLEPAFLSVTSAAGECFTERKEAWLTPELVQADIFFAIDLTGSMGGVRAQLQANMNDIISRVQSFVPDVAFGLASYKDYNGTFTTLVPCVFNSNYGGGDYPYLLHQPMTTNRTNIETAVAALPPASGGGDLPESYNRLLYEALNDPGIGWRPGSRRLIVNFGDEMPHDCNVLECLGARGAARGVDPGRDNVIGTADDLFTMQLIQNLADNDIALLHLTNSFASDGPFTYNQIWDCWARITGGQGTQLNANGTVPGGLDLAELVADLIRSQGSFCRELQLVAEPGYESWVASATPIYTDISLPAFVEFDIQFCVPPGTPDGPYDFTVRLMCGDQVVTTQQVHVDVSVDCSSSVVSVPANVTICDGGMTTLDASGMSVVNCSGTAVYEWRDDLGNLVGSAATVDVSPVTTTTYTVTVSCSTDPTCSASSDVDVVVEQRPELFSGELADPAPCNIGLDLVWDAATFPSGAGTYNIYRSETSCADALTRAPINPPNHAVNAYIDLGTRSGRTYYYAIVAEDAGSAVACLPPGPNNGGVVSSGAICLGPVTDEATAGFPDYLGWSLRVSHQGQQVTLDWTGSRALLPGEHFHVTKGTDPSILSMVNAEGQVTLQHVETDTSSTLQFFDVRIANSCEEISLDDEPPGWDVPR